MQDPEENNVMLPRLSEAHARAVDDLIDRRALGPRLADDVERPAAPPKALAEVERALALIGSSPTEEPGDDLVDRTMRRVISATSIDFDVMRMQSTPAGSASTLPIRLGEIVAVAAMVLIGASLALPVLVRTREDALRVACQANMSASGKAFAAYAADYIGAMPRGRVEANATWYHIGRAMSAADPVRSNSSNLYLLGRTGYIDPNTLACPSNEHSPRGMTRDMYDWASAEAVSYSYQNQFGRRTTRLHETPYLAVLADKNPKFLIRQGETDSLTYLGFTSRNSPSLAHGIRGQNILMADGSVWGSVHPIIPGGDNIWLARDVEEYVGNEVPAGPDDTFLVP